MEYRQLLLDITKWYMARSIEPGLGLLGLFEGSNRLGARLNCLKRGAGRCPRVRAAMAVGMVVLMMVCVLPMAQAQEEAVETESATAEQSDPNVARQMEALEIQTQQVRQAVADWRKQFNEVYRLENDKVLRRVAPPFIPERERYYVEERSHQGEAKPEPPDFITFHWDGELRLWERGYSASGNRSLKRVLIHTLALVTFDFEGPENLLELDIPGDWILRKDASQEDKLHALEEILKEDFGRHIRFIRRQVDREVIVARGKFHFNPLTGTNDDSRVHVYADILIDEGWGMGSGNLSKFLRNVGNQLNFRVVDETREEGNEDNHKKRIPWTLHRDSHHAEMMDEDRMAKVNKVLSNLAKQTSLTFTIERRPVDIWIVEDALSISRSATQQAKEVGVEVLPFPVLGLPYDFALTSVEGQIIDSKTFRGKVLLIDCWASWCWPCIKKMPKMKELYAKWHSQNLEIISVNLDFDERTMTKAVKSLSLPWPQIMVPDESSARELWHKATGIKVIPRCLIVDRQGILRADCSPKELEQELTRIIRLETPQ